MGWMVVSLLAILGSQGRKCDREQAGWQLGARDGPFPNLREMVASGRGWGFDPNKRST